MPKTCTVAHSGNRRTDLSFGKKEDGPWKGKICIVGSTHYYTLFSYLSSLKQRDTASKKPNESNLFPYTMTLFSLTGVSFL